MTSSGWCVREQETGIQRAISRAFRVVLSIALALSLAGSGLSAYSIWRNPAFQWLVDAGNEQIQVQIARLATSSVTQEALDAQLAKFLDKPKRNWVAIEAIEETAATRNLTPSPAIATRRKTAWEEDSGVWHTAKKCAACAWDPKGCDLSAVLICRAPVDLTPVGDIAGVVRESRNYLLGRNVDFFDLSLSIVGLGATVLVFPSGGSSVSIKMGATALKTGRRMGMVSPSLAKYVIRTGKRAIDWRKIAEAKPLTFFSDVRGAFHPAAIRPFTQMLQEAGAMRAKVGLVRTLDMLSYASNAKEVHAFGRAVRAGGNQVVGLLRLAGKSRLIRATLRYSPRAARLFLWLTGIVMSLAGFALHLFGVMAFKRLRKRARS
ncbi:MAG: hypothetical protein GXP05_15850 [Alphaproteobacteria bacterium]|nr:hypothetical protein [Alphaproteobacteria bacterium]